MANYFCGGTLNYPYVAIPTVYQTGNMGLVSNEYLVNDRTQTKTLDCQRYSFKLHGMIFHFIDTPGINDTRSSPQSDRNVAKTLSYIENLKALRALILILNGAVARTTINIKNVLSIYRDRLPNAIDSNIIIVLTNCEQHTVNFRPSSLNLSEKCSVFYMQNSAFATNPNTWSHRAMDVLRRDFTSSMRTIDSILKKLLSLRATSTNVFRDLNDDRHEIKEQLCQTRTTISDLQIVEDELTIFESSAHSQSINPERFPKFMRERMIPQNRRIPTPYYNTICFDCQTTCHEMCSSDEVPKSSFNNLLRCSVINQNGWCLRCPNKCSDLVHFHGQFIIKKTMFSLAMIVENIRQRNLQTKNGQEAVDSKYNDLQTVKKLLEYELRQQYEQVKVSIISLQHTCKDSNVTTILCRFVELLEKDVFYLKSSSVIIKSREFIANLQQLCVASERSRNHQPTLQFRTAGDRMARSPVICTSPKSDAGMISTKTRTNGELHDQNVDERSSRKTLYLPLPNHRSTLLIKENSYNEDSDDSHDAHNNEQKTKYQEPFVPSTSTKHKEKLVSQQDTTYDQSGIRHKLERENLDMLPTNKLVRLRDSDMDDFDINEIREILKRRCDGESTGYLSTNEQLILCEEYAKHEWENFRDLRHLSRQLLDEINEITDGDPFRINLVPIEKRLLLSAVKLVIKRGFPC